MGWMVAKVKTEKQEGTNSRVYSGYDVHMYPKRTNVPLQALGRRAVTVGAISGPHCQIVALHWHSFTSHGFTRSAKSTL